MASGDIIEKTNTLDTQKDANQIVEKRRKQAIKAESDLQILIKKNEAEADKLKRSNAAKQAALTRKLTAAQAAADQASINSIQEQKLKLAQEYADELAKLNQQIADAQIESAKAVVRKVQVEQADANKKQAAAQNQLRQEAITEAQLLAKYGEDAAVRMQGYTELVANSFEDSMDSALDSITKTFSGETIVSLTSSATTFADQLKTKFGGVSLDLNDQIAEASKNLAIIQEYARQQENDLQARIDAKLAEASDPDASQEDKKSASDEAVKLQAKLLNLKRKNEKEIAKFQQQAEESLSKQREDSVKKAAEEAAKALTVKLDDRAKDLVAEINDFMEGGSVAGFVAKYGMKAASAFQDKAFGSIDEYMGVYSEHMSEVTARLNGAGTNYDYKHLEEQIRKNTVTSPYVKYTDTLDNLASLVELGIADNVLQRAFLQTVSDKVVTTFDAHTSSMLQIIRLQQKDSTAARMGMEAELNRLFNHYFSDTSYLSDSFDAVQAALIDVSSQLSYDQGVEFEYIVQKWLGSLGSVGVNSNTLSTIATAISQLGTGNVGALSGNSAMQNLLVMSANRAGLDYGELFNNLSAGAANALLGSMVSYLKEVASSNNNIVKSQYADLFGVEISDLNAFTNIQNSVIEDLMKSGMTYSDTLVELNEQLGEVPNRIHISERMDILLDNIFANIGTQIAGSPALSGIYKAASFLEGVTGGIELPFISAFGNGFDLNMSLEGLIKSGVAGIGMIGTIVDALGNIGGSMDINDWSVTMNKGEGLRYKNVKQMTSTTSTTGTISSSNSTGISQSLSDQQKSVGEEVNGTEPDKDEELLVILRALKQYFVEDKFGSEHNPVKSQVTVTNFNELSTLEGLSNKMPT